MDDRSAPLFLDPALFQRHRRRLTEVARGLLGSQADAEDIVQDAYLRSQAAAAAPPRSAEAWLLTVVRHLAIDRLRRRRREGEALHQWQQDAVALRHLSAPAAEQTARLSLDAAVALRVLLQCLDRVEAAAVLLREVFEADYAEIARSAGRSEAACRQLVHRALRRLGATPPGPSRVDGNGAEDALFSLCWRALQSGSPAPLFRLLALPAGAPAARAAAAPPPCPRGGTPASHFAMVQLGGRFAVALMLDGQLLCTLPVGPCGDAPSGPARDDTAFEPRAVGVAG